MFSYLSSISTPKKKTKEKNIKIIEILDNRYTNFYFVTKWDGMTIVKSRCIKQCKKKEM